MRNKNWMGILATALVFGFTVMGCGAFTDMNKVSNYLSLAERVGRSASGPVPLAVKIDLSGSDWEKLLSIINGAGVYVNLDLSRSIMANTEFNPGSNGSGFVVSLVLPDAVTSIAGDFNVFSNLASISLPASADTGGMNPFVGCSSLTFKLRGRGDLSAVEQGKALVRGGSELVSYPSVSGDVTLNGITALGRSAFNGVGLESISLPSVTTVGVRAFRGCEKLHTVNLPTAATIGDEAFYGNKKLQALNIPAAVTIGNNAAANTGGMNLTITVGQQIETVGTELFSEVGERKNVTVKVPQSEVEDVTAMRDAFRGRGWSDGAFTLAAGRNQTTGSGWYQRTVWVNNFNSYINLTVEGY